MTYTAKYLDADHEYVSRSDMPGSTISASPANRHFREILDDGVAISDYVAPAISSEQVKAKAERLILALIPEWKQRNLSARAAELAMKKANGGDYTTEELAEIAAGQAIWDQVKAIRTASDAIEASPPANEDALETDPRWP